MLKKKEKIKTVITVVFRTLFKDTILLNFAIFSCQLSFFSGAFCRSATQKTAEALCMSLLDFG